MADEIHVRHYSSKTLKTYQGWMQKLQTFTHSKPTELLSTDDGYLTAARALDVLSYEELKEAIDKIHFDVFGKSIDERHRSELVETASEENTLAIPTYIRKEISLGKE